MAFNLLAVSNSGAIVATVDQPLQHISFRTVINDMVKEYGVSKTHSAIQALYDEDELDQRTAGFMLDVLKAEHCSRKQANRMIPLL